MFNSLNYSHSHHIDTKFIFRANCYNSFIDIVVIQSFEGLYYGLKVDEIFCWFYFIDFCYYYLDVYVIVVAAGNKL